MTVLALAVLTGEAQAGAADITVDAANIAAPLPKFWTSAVGTGSASLTLRADLQTHYKFASRELGMQRVRGHGVLSDDMGIYKGPGSYDFTNFDKYLSAIAAANMRPLMELTFMPTALARNGNSRDPPGNLTEWQNLIKAVVAEAVKVFGPADVQQWYWEVWNEPNFSGFWNGTQADYFNLYDSAVAGATAALPNILIGGPATTSGSGAWMQAFLSHTKSGNIRVNFLSSHAYGGGGSPGTTADVGSIISDNTARVSLITGAGYSMANVASLNTEYNSSFSGQGGNQFPNCQSMDDNVNAPFILKTVGLFADEMTSSTPPLSVISYWTVSDVFGEACGDACSYIQNTGGGTLPFGEVFGLVNYQGIRKAAFNGYKMLNYLGPNRLAVSGGSGTSDGIDAIAAVSSGGDEVEVIVYDYSSTIGTSGSDSVTLTIHNLPFTGQAYVTEFLIDSTHTNPFGVWQGEGSPTNPTEAQLEAMKVQQHLMPVAAPAQQALSGTFTTTLTMNKQSAAMFIIGKSRPLTGRNAFVHVEGEDYDGQSGVTKENGNDSDLGQAILTTAKSSAFYLNVDLSDAGANSVQLRVNAAAPTSVDLMLDSATGTKLATCPIAATTGYATETCNFMTTAGVHNLYLNFAGPAHLNWLVFQGPANVGPGDASDGGGSSADSGTSGDSGGAGMTGSSSGTVSSGSPDAASGSSGGGAGGLNGGGAMGGSSGGGSAIGSAGGKAGDGGTGASSATGAGGSPRATSSAGGGCSMAGSRKSSGGACVIAAVALAALRRRRHRAN